MCFCAGFSKNFLVGDKMRFIWLFSAVSVPILVIFVIAYGLIRGVKVYDEFCCGAKDGLLLVIKILPYIFSFLLLNSCDS